MATFLQLKVTKHTGIGLPVVLGCASSASPVAPLSIIGAKQGSGAMFGALIASGIYVILVAGVFLKIARFFPPIVTGSYCQWSSDLAWCLWRWEIWEIMQKHQQLKV